MMLASLFVWSAVEASAQNKPISGTVTDASGVPVIGAETVYNVMLQEDSQLLEETVVIGYGSSFGCISYFKEIYKRDLIILDSWSKIFKIFKIVTKKLQKRQNIFLKLKKMG